MRRFLAFLLFFSSLLGTACAKKDEPTPPPPCSVGVNVDSCANEIRGSNFWARQFDVVRTDPATKKNVKVKDVTVVNEFTASDDGTIRWRRSGTVRSADLNEQTMIIEGRVLSIDKEKMRLTIDRSTCDGIDQSFRIDAPTDPEGAREVYYLRTGNRLSLSTKPFRQIEVKSSGNIIGDIFGTIITGVIGALMQSMIDGATEVMVNVFTLGLMRDVLKDGSGEFRAIPLKELATQTHLTDFRAIGCFEGRELGSDRFTPIK